MGRAGMGTGVGGRSVGVEFGDGMRVLVGGGGAVGEETVGDSQADRSRASKMRALRFDCMVPFPSQYQCQRLT